MKITVRVGPAAGTARVPPGVQPDQEFAAVHEPHPETDMHDERPYGVISDELRAL
ncbi:hypothetical protein ACIBCT_29675 [Streptosporangium sp. NPDC050855]|uniref:hypothetical protein n=1 Tax=Streptosporangium sp. NPDC050855 TaxID=3366194 RepID=UPI0037AB0CC6